MPEQQFKLTHYRPVTVAAIQPGFAGWSVEFWCEHTEGAPEFKRTFQVFGTGQPLPEDAKWIGTCARTGSGLVWHLYELGVGHF